MPIDIKGKTYVTVAERIAELHKQLDKNCQVRIETEILLHSPVLTKSTVTITRDDKDSVFTGISAANPNKTLEKMSPYEISETSSVGRALGFAGFGSVESIASADEMTKASYAEHVFSAPSPTTQMPLESPTEPVERLSQAQLKTIAAMIKNTKYGNLEAYEAQTGVDVSRLSSVEASTLIKKILTYTGPPLEEPS